MYNSIFAFSNEKIRWATAMAGMPLFAHAGGREKLTPPPLSAPSSSKLWLCGCGCTCPALAHTPSTRMEIRTWRSAIADLR